jgi:hypothetical protein
MLRQAGLAEIDRVAHGGAADRVDARDARLEHADVARERHVDARLVVEVEDEHFVLRIGLAHVQEQRVERPHRVLVRRQVAAHLCARADERRPAVDRRHVAAHSRSDGDDDAIVGVDRLADSAGHYLPDALQPDPLVELDPKWPARVDDEVD